MVEKLFHELSQLDEVEAIALGGSRAGSNFDEKSDYDVYVYITDMVSEETRKEILSKYCSVMEIGNHFWEYEDNCTLNDGIDIDILWRNLDDFSAGVAEVVENFQAHNGYTTCMWHNLLTCKVLYDRDGRLQAAVDRFRVPYPKQLKENIMGRNMQLLRNTLPAYDTQIRKALRREDVVSINHRTAAFMESYFDVIFALNEVTHPGEKRLVSLCLKQCKILPANFEENIQKLFAHLFTDFAQVESDLSDIIMELEKVTEC